jgi:hypothetical protein
MKRAVLLSLTLAALPLFADEAKKSETKKSEETAKAAPAAAPAQAPAAEQSPLVAAAKRTNRLGKKPANVITNDTLKKSGSTAHVTTSEKVVPMPVPPADAPHPTPEMIADREKAEKKKYEEQKAAEKKKADEARAARRAAAAEMTEEEYHPDDVDPAQAEKAQADAHAEKPPR